MPKLKDKISIIAHRGLWKNKYQQNTIKSLVNAMSNGFGIEFDVRDAFGEIVISHDYAKSSKKIEFFKNLILKYKKLNLKSTLAINIKSDGLSGKIKKILKVNKVSNYFVFDMSFPEKIMYKKKGLNFFNRMSEFERNSKFDLYSKGLWIDCFKRIWYNKEIIKKIKYNNLCFVSPELHRRKNYKRLWYFLKKLKIKKNLSVCTDYPIKARKFFND